MHHLSKTALCALAIVAFMLTAWAQAPSSAQGGQESDGQAVFRADTRLVVLHATVVDRRGNLVTDLTASAFRVYEDNVQQTIRIFRREDVPVSMGLIIDNSGSMRDKRAKVEAATMGLVKASNRDDEVFVVNFNDDAYLDVEMTADMQKMEEGLTRIDSRGGTAMRDAISMSIDYLMEKAKRDKKVLVVVTDGNDNTSSVSLEKLVQKAQQSEVLVYSIGILNDEDRREAKRAKRALDAITDSTGGLSYYPEALAEIDKLALDVAHDIRNQYLIAYTPTRPEMDGSYRRIRVQAEGRRGLVVRTRSGYYARQGGDQADSGQPSVDMAAASFTGNN
jgi:Ca-activated chloride channel homolog